MPQRDDATTVQLKIRIKEPLRAAIEDDAEARRVTMNAVINDRLEQSFREHGRARDLREALALAFGADVTAVMLAIGLAIRDVVNASPVPPDRKKLLSNALLFDQSVAAIDTVIESVRPAALHDNDEYLLPEEKAGMEQWQMLGRDVGAQVCWQITEHPEWLGPWGSSIRDWLGPDAIERMRAKVEAIYHSP